MERDDIRRRRRLSADVYWSSYKGSDWRTGVTGRRMTRPYLTSRGSGWRGSKKTRPVAMTVHRHFELWSPSKNWNGKKKSEFEDYRYLWKKITMKVLHSITRGGVWEERFMKKHSGIKQLSNFSMNNSWIDEWSVSPMFRVFYTGEGNSFVSRITFLCLLTALFQ